MANLLPGNMENIFILLSQHNFTIRNSNVHDFKCIICGRILNNAYQAMCGCNYCQECVGERVRAGEVICPGTSEECRITNLSNVVPDHKMNRQISQLIVKCPAETCNYESQLRMMEDHLRLCPKKSIECPFNDVGCDRGKLPLDKLEEHLQQMSLRHSEILIEVIGNLRNEVAELKRDGEKYRRDIDRLAQCDTDKGAIIDLMKEEITSLKLENVALERRMENLLEGKCDKAAMETDARCMWGKIESLIAQLREMRRERRAERERMAVADAEEMEEEKECRIEMTEAIDTVEDDDDFVWPVDNIAEWRNMCKEIYSEYFDGCVEPYKMRLRRYSYYDQLKIYLCIHSGDSDGSLCWPFDRRVTITIANQMRRQTRKSVTKYCTINKPSNNYYIWSDEFIFKWSELMDEGILRKDRLTVRCSIRYG